jgi:hypothetical protein
MAGARSSNIGGGVGLARAVIHVGFEVGETSFDRWCGVGSEEVEATAEHRQQQAANQKYFFH